MSLDFLRQIAFEGELRTFFREDPLELAHRSTGMHLRFNEWFLRFVAEGVRRTGYRGSFGESSRPENWYDRLDFASALNATLDYVWQDERNTNDRDWHPRPGMLDFMPYLDLDTKDLNRRKIVLIVVDVPDSNNELLAKGPREYEGFPILYRVSGPIHAHYAVGSALNCHQAGTKGTLCSFLEDVGCQRVFALTCGHFAQAPGYSIADGAGNYNRLGTVDQLVMPADAGPCNRYARPDDNSVDAALIEVNPNAPVSQGVRKAVQPIASINPGDLVEFIGRGTGRVRPAKVMSATIWKPIDLLGNGQLVCCGDIFEIGHQAANYVNSSLSRPGDSGAAVRRLGQHGSPDQWFGMLIGGERSSSYICYAQHVLQWASNHYPNISLLP